MPASYVAACKVARETTKARGVILIVLEGEHGNGLITLIKPDQLAMIKDVPDLLRWATEHSKVGGISDIKFMPESGTDLAGN
jgi:hypothetical protein